MLPVCLLTWLEGPPARLICCGGEDLGNGSTTRARTAAHWQADELLCHIFSQGNLAVWREDNGYASPSLTHLSGSARTAQVSGSALPAGFTGPEDTSVGFVR